MNQPEPPLAIATHSEAAFETVIGAHLLDSGYVRIAREGFDREHAILPETVLAFIRDTQPQEWAKLEALHGDKTGDQILTDLCKWMDANGSLATLRHGFKCYGRTLHCAFFKAAHELNPELESRYAANRLGLTRQLHFSPANPPLHDAAGDRGGVHPRRAEALHDVRDLLHDHIRESYERSESRTVLSTASYIAGVTVPVFVFCRDGWYMPTSV